MSALSPGLSAFTFAREGSCFGQRPLGDAQEVDRAIEPASIWSASHVNVSAIGKGSARFQASRRRVFPTVQINSERLALPIRLGDHVMPSRVVHFGFAFQRGS